MKGNQSKNDPIATYGGKPTKNTYDTLGTHYCTVLYLHPTKNNGQGPTKNFTPPISPCYTTPKHEIKISNTDENLAKHLSI